MDALTGDQAQMQIKSLRDGHRNVNQIPTNCTRKEDRDGDRE